MPVTAPAQRPSPKKAKRGSRGRSILAVLLVLAGVLVMMYPVAATQLSNYHQAQVANEYSDLVKVAPPQSRDAELKAAEEYNAEHTAGVPKVDPWQGRVDPSDVGYQQYLQTLRVEGTEEDAAISQIRIPSINVNLPIFHGTDPDTLERGVGHLYGTSLPVGGPGTHSVLTGHTGITKATLFDNLTKVKEGDVFYLNTMGRKMKYQVDQIKVVLPDQIDDIAPIADRDLATLITCTPYGINSHRLLVRGTRVPMDPDEEEEAFRQSSGIQWTWWMILAVSVLGIMLLVLLLLTLSVILRKFRQKNVKESKKLESSADES